MRKMQAFLLSTLCVFGFVGGAASQSTREGRAEGNFAVSELFLSEAASVQSGYAPEESNLTQTAIFFGTDVENARVRLKNTVAGEFSMLCEPVLSDGSSTLRTMSITFTDVKTEESFDIHVVFGEQANVSVVMDDEQAGIAYQKNNKISMTGIANASGIYTKYDSMLLPITFAPDTMEVHVGNGAMKKLVWDLSESENDNRTLTETREGFEEYTVSITMHDFVGSSSGLSVYSLNEYTLGKTVIKAADAGRPQISAKITEKGLKGKRYKLPFVTAYDLVDGGIEEVERTLLAPDGSTVATDGDTFQPTATGKYTLTYKAYNSFGNVGEKTYTIEVLETMPSYGYEPIEKLPSKSVVGESIYLPEMKIFGGLTIDYEKLATVTVKRNGVAQIAAMNRESGFTYTFANAGDYEIVYNVPDEEVVFNVQVADVKTDATLNVDIARNYNRNAYVDLSSAKLVVDGALTDFDLTVTNPMGVRFTNKQFVCSETGVYTLTAISKTDKSRTATYTFTVLNRGQDLFGGSEDVVTQYGKSMVTQANGVLAYTKSSGAAIKYQQKIDLTKYVDQTTVATGVDDDSKNAIKTFKEKYGDDKVGISETATPLIEFSVQPHAYDKRAMNGVSIHLTDVNDPDNRLTIKLFNINKSEKVYSHVRAAAGDQILAGYNVVDSLFYVDNWGYRVQHTFMGSFDGAGFDMRKSRVALFYDYEEKRVLVGEEGATRNRMSVVADLDDPRLCGGEPWNGFSTGEVELSIEISGIIYNQAGIAIYSVDGTDLSQDAIVYDEPTIMVDAEYTEGLKGKQFAVPKASAYDTSGAEVSVQTQVVYVAQNGKEYDINVRKGVFDTSRAGKYRIRYFATDKYGNEGIKEIEIIAHETYASLAASADVPSTYKTGKTGEKIGLFPVGNIAVRNALGGVSASVTVTGNGERIEVQDGAFKPQKVGAYTVTYTLTDGVGRTTTLTYVVDVELETELVIESAIPEYVGFIEGNTYELYDLFVINYVSGSGEPVKADIYINGEKYEDDVYTPSVSEVEDKDAAEVIRYVRLEYKYGDKVIVGYDLPVRNVYKYEPLYMGAELIGENRKFRMERYFYAESGVKIGLNQKGDALSLETTENDAVARFLQPLTARGLNIAFDITGKKTSYEEIDTNVRAIHVYVTDAKDKNKRIKLTFVTEEGKTRLYVNGEMAAGMPSGALDGTSQNTFDIKLNTTSWSIVNSKDNQNLIILKNYLDGSAFTGFGEQVYVGFEVERKDVQKSATIEVVSLNGQNFSNAYDDDKTPPEIEVRGEMEMNYSSGSTMTVLTATASDVLSNVAEVTVSVTHNGVAVKDVNGKTLENVSANVTYEVLLSEAGQYLVSYTAKDGRGATSVAKTFVVRSIVDKNPVIKVDGEVPTTVKVGTEVILPNFSVTYLENNEDNLDYGVYITPSNRYQYLTENKFTPDAVGKYKVRYFALDAYGNHAIWECVIEVTA